MLKKFLKNRENQAEIIRFVIVGIICTGIDFLVSSLFLFIIYPDAKYSVFVSTLLGQVVGIIANYLLSVLFVYKNLADKRQSRSVSGFLLFALFSTLAFGINYGLKELFNFILPFEGRFFWYAVVFAFVTLITLIFNYVTRKIFIFKPKQENDEVPTP